MVIVNTVQEKVAENVLMWRPIDLFGYLALCFLVFYVQINIIRLTNSIFTIYIID